MLEEMEVEEGVEDETEGNVPMEKGKEWSWGRADLDNNTTTRCVYVCFCVYVFHMSNVVLSVCVHVCKYTFPAN